MQIKYFDNYYTLLSELVHASLHKAIEIWIFPKHNWIRIEFKEKFNILKETEDIEIPK